MKGDELYEEFKDALKYLGLLFNGMAAMRVTIVNQYLCFSCRGKVVSIHIPRN